MEEKRLQLKKSTEHTRNNKLLHILKNNGIDLETRPQLSAPCCSQKRRPTRLICDRSVARHFFI
ncbi:hypothetical protein J6590_056506 [Homalodisca vitripennis]|nr:hypothetical protein J6590_056506 [Homalodisca vitripennis]